jgi:hypothetical protein
LSITIDIEGWIFLAYPTSIIENKINRALITLGLRNLPVISGPRTRYADGAIEEWCICRAEG